MASVVSPYILNHRVTIPVTRRAILARKRVTRSDPYKKFEAGQIYQIYGWEVFNLKGYCLAQNMVTGEWQCISEEVFNWDKPDFEISINAMKKEIEDRECDCQQNGNQDTGLEGR